MKVSDWYVVGVDPRVYAVWRGITSSDRHRIHRITGIQRNLDENMSSEITSSVPADGLAPVGMGSCIYRKLAFNILRPRQNGLHFPEDILKWIFLSENMCISIKILLKLLFMFQHWFRWWLGADQPLSEPMMVKLLTHMWITLLQWVKWLIESRTIMIII